MISSFAQHLRASGKAAGTIEQRIGDIKRLESTFPNLLEVKHRDLEGYFTEKHASWSPNYRRRVISSVAIFYRWAKRNDWTDHNPAKRLATFKVPRSLPHPAPDEVILQAFDDASPAVRAMLCLASSGGLRRSEIAVAHPRDRTGDRLRVHGKGSKDRSIPLEPLTLSLLRDPESFQGPDSYYFPGGSGDGHLHDATVYKRIKAHIGRDWTPHSLRHRAATVGLRGTGNLRAMQEFLGHASPDTTQIYTKIDSEDLREITKTTSLTDVLIRRRMALLAGGSVTFSGADDATRMSISEALSVIQDYERRLNSEMV